MNGVRVFFHQKGHHPPVLRMPPLTIQTDVPDDAFQEGTSSSCDVVNIQNKKRHKLLKITRAQFALLPLLSGNWLNEQVRTKNTGCSEKDTIYVSEPKQRKTYNKKIRPIFRSQDPIKLRLFDTVRLLGFCWYLLHEHGTPSIQNQTWELCREPAARGLAQVALLVCTELCCECDSTAYRHLPAQHGCSMGVGAYLNS